MMDKVVAIMTEEQEVFNRYRGGAKKKSDSNSKTPGTFRAGG